MVAPGTVWSNDMSDHDDRPSVMLVETLGSNIKWTEPRDFVLSAESKGDSEELQPTIGSNHKLDPGYFYHDIPGVHAAFSDGSIYLLPTAIFSNGNIPRINGQFIEEAVDHWIAEHRRVHWPHTVGLAVWIVSLVLLIHWMVRCKRKTDTRAAIVLSTEPTDNSH